MTLTLHTAAVAVLAALAAVAAIIAADFTPPVSAQNDGQCRESCSDNGECIEICDGDGVREASDESIEAIDEDGEPSGESCADSYVRITGEQSGGRVTAGRVVARRLDDGRVEFGWQPTGGTRILPRQRNFPTDAQVDRWLRSSPITVAGIAIGRINARLHSDGRIEFAFTPTDHERIQPRERYFPADAQVGRWLRSTEITFAPPVDTRDKRILGVNHFSSPPATVMNADCYASLSKGGLHTCAIQASGGAIECWGNNWFGQANSLEGRFTAVSAGWYHTCAIRGSGEIACWGRNYNSFLGVGGQSDPPPGRFTAVAAGQNHSCAIRESGEIACWGGNNIGQSDAPPGRYTAVTADAVYSCAIRASDSKLVCWGWSSYIPDGRFTAVSAGETHVCAIRESSGAIVCWGYSNRYGQSDAPPGSYIAIGTGEEHTCALREDKTIACWGESDPGYSGGQSDAPEGRFTDIAVGNWDTCAFRENNGAIVCWP